MLFLITFKLVNRKMCSIWFDFLLFYEPLLIVNAISEMKKKKNQDFYCALKFVGFDTSVTDMLWEMFVF